MKVKFFDFSDKNYSIDELFSFYSKSHLSNSIFICLSSNAIVRFSKGDVGLDLSSVENYYFDDVTKVQTFLIPTGVKTSLPLGFEAQVRLRSSTPIKMGLFLPNSPGTIDPLYRGEIKVILSIFNLSKFMDYIKTTNGIIPRGTRFSQLIINPALSFCNFSYPQEISIVIARSQELFDSFVDYFPSERGDSGFGSTG